jgi:hypothetical protein
VVLVGKHQHPNQKGRHSWNLVVGNGKWIQAIDVTQQISRTEQMAELYKDAYIEWETAGVRLACKHQSAEA